MDDELMRSIHLAHDILSTIDGRTDHEITLAKAIMRWSGFGTLDEQNQRLEEWARGADERVSEAHDALTDAGIGSRRASGGQLLRIGERVRMLAARRSVL